MKPISENAGVAPGARENFTSQNRPQPQTKNNKDFEDRRNAAACFKNPAKREGWHPDYVGVLVTEDLPAGTKCWVNVRKRLTRKGEVYVSVTLKPKKEGDRP